MGWLLPISKQNNVTSIVGRLILVASSYFVWQGQSNRVHGKSERNLEQLSKIIVERVILKLASFRFKKKVSVDKMKNTWKIASILTNGAKAHRVLCHYLCYMISSYILYYLVVRFWGCSKPVSYLMCFKGGSLPFFYIYSYSFLFLSIFTRYIPFTPRKEDDIIWR